MTEKSTTAIEKRSPFQLAGDVANRVDLVSVAMRSWSVDFLGDDALPVLPGAASVDLNHKTTFIPPTEGRHLFVLVEFSLTVREGSQDGPERIRMKGTLGLKYTTIDALEVQREAFEHFANLNGVINAWPYIREMVHAATNRMGLPPLILPLFRTVRRRPASASTPGSSVPDEKQKS